MAGVMKTRHGAASAVGRRPDNEDAYVARHPVFVVADGMGGYEAGELASAAAVQAMQQLLERSPLGIEDVSDALAQAAHAVHSIPLDEGTNAGTTLAAVVVGEVDRTAYWLVANLGDSRVYRLAASRLGQVSVDHSEVQELIDRGSLTPDEARRHPRRHVVTRAMGPVAEVEADYWVLPAEAHDRMLICSDGLTAEIDDEQIRAILLREPDPQLAAEVLVAVALQAGGRDNITVIVVDAVAVQADTQAGERTDVGSSPDDEPTLPRSVAVGGGAG